MEFETRIEGTVAVVGDVHGHLDRLTSVLEQLRTVPDFERRWIVLIGDFIDRGPDSKGVIDLIVELMVEHPRTTAIMGNHEYAMAAALGLLPLEDCADWADRWVEYYGSEPTFESYGVEHGDLEALGERMPDSHKEFLATLPWMVEHSRYLFVHAGLDPNQPYEVQRKILQQRDFTLTRPTWLCAKHLANGAIPDDCPKIIVSGHVQVPDVQAYDRRLLIDTTGGEFGDLSCVLLPDNQIITSAGAQAAQTAELKQRGSVASWFRFWK